MAGNFYQDMIGKVTGSTNQSNAALTQTAEMLTGIANKQQAAFDQSNATMTEAIASAAILAGKKAAVEYKERTQLQEAQRLLGLDPDDANNAIAAGMNQ